MKTIEKILNLHWTNRLELESLELNGYINGWWWNWWANWAAWSNVTANTWGWGWWAWAWSIVWWNWGSGIVIISYATDWSDWVSQYEQNFK